MKSVNHPVLGKNYQLMFDEAAHEYRVSDGTEDHKTFGRTAWDDARPVLSVTQLVKHYAPEFDGPGIAAKVAAKNNTTAEAVQAEWTAAADMGTRVHANQEGFMKYETMPRERALSEREHNIMRHGWYAFQAITAYGWIPTAAEVMVFSYSLRLAGTIDAYFTRDREVLLVDWKTNKEIRRANKYGGKMLGPVAHLDDCEFSKYALQLNLYARILREDAYIPAAQAVRMVIMHLRPDAFESIPVPVMPEVDAVLFDYVKNGYFQDVPF